MRQPSIYSKGNYSFLSGSSYTENDTELQEAIMSQRPSLHKRLAYSIAVWSFKAYFVLMLRTTRMFQRRPTDMLVPEVRSYPIRPNLKNRIFRPAGLEGNLPVYLDIHGGGWTVADPETDDEFCSFLARKCGIMVISIDYRKAPKYKFPCAVHDVAAVVDAVLNDETLNFDRSKVVLGGFSAGGNLAFAASQMVALKGRIQSLVGLYPILDSSQTLEEKLSYRAKGGPSDILASSAAFLDFAYVPANVNRRDPFLSPIYFNPEDLPKNVYLVGAEHDMLCHEANRMAEKLAASQTRDERASITGLREEDGWKQGGIRWEWARGKQHAFTHITQSGRKEKERVRFCQDMYSRIGSWLTEEVWSNSQHD